MNGNYQRLSDAIDRLENLSMILTMPLPATKHVEQLRAAMPGLIKDFKAGYIEATGEDPWQNWKEKSQ
ncbi:hypothetical protein GCM10023189_10980 [Nibrella saemangeumensis]|uniref:Uncharacterized protein n=1 Tax=Nibrella saemangeumensis TaxID=1084526 RepID=A0ABP8MJC0_9BACT